MTWQSVSIGDVLQLEYGKPLPDEDRSESGQYAVYGANGEKARSNRYYHGKPSIVVGRKGSAGEIRLTEEKFWPLDVTYFATFDESRYDLKFLYYLLGTLDLPSMARGVKPGINRNDVYSLNVRVPPIAEQHRIVAILDKAFAGIATAKANAEKSLKSARAVFQAALASRLDKSNDWPERRLGELCEIARGGSPRPIKAFLTGAEDGVNWIKISDASASSKYIYQTKEKIKPAGLSRSRLVRSGDFLLSNSMSFGRPYIMRTSGCIHDGWLVLSKYEGSFDQDFLYLLLGSQFIYQQFDRLASGSTVRNLNIELASRVSIPVPPLETQKEIARELEGLEGEVSHLQSTYIRKLAALDELRQSLLQRAFAGQL